MRQGISLGSVRQLGATPVGMICTLLVVVSAVSMALKVGPHYIDFRTIQSVIEALPAGEVNTMSRAEIFEAVEKRFPLNGLYDFKVRDIMQFDRGPESTKLMVDYEKREPLFMNLDVVIKFKKEYEFH